MSGANAFLGVLIAVQCLSGGFTYPSDGNHNGMMETPMYGPPPARDPFRTPLQQQQFDDPKSCFHFFVSRNMSALLSEATQMLRRVKDKHEREWILTFVLRIRSLAEHLRSHPESRNERCLPGPGQHELYFVEDSAPAAKRSGPVNDTRGNPFIEKLIKEDAAPQKVSSTSAEEAAVASEPVSASSTQASQPNPNEVPPKATYVTYEIDPYDQDLEEVGLLPPNYVRGDYDEDVLVKQLHTGYREPVARRSGRYWKNMDKEALMDEMMLQVERLRKLGGTKSEFLSLWEATDNDNDQPATGKSDPASADFDYEEQGAAAGELQAEDSDPTVAPSLGEVLSSRTEDGDALERQLAEAKFDAARVPPSDSNLPSETTRPLGGYSSTEAIPMHE